MADDPRHPHISTGYEHGAADPTPATPVEAPQGEKPADDKPAPKRRAAAKK